MHDDPSQHSHFEPIPSSRALVPIADSGDDEFLSLYTSSSKPARRRAPRGSVKALLISAVLTLSGGAVFLPDSPPGQILAELRRGAQGDPEPVPRYNPLTHEGTGELVRYSRPETGKNRELMLSLKAHATPPGRLIAENTLDNEELRARLRWQFGQTLRRLMASQQALQAFYLQHRDWPSRDTAPPLPAAGSPYIRDLELRGSGELLATLSGEFGRNGQIRMTPEKPDQLGRFRWHCLTNIPIQNDPGDEQSGPPCRYNPYAF
ncbi:hypothetical protein Q4485_05860 [Granulosicoccaceae sp. 1_MG-2023]|nr:hypothetical protein [Granulosicoccaceae sp. 1_MG-2023]